MAADPKKLIVAIRRGLDDPRYAHAWADLIGKVGKEIGGNHGADDTRPVIFHFHTNLNPLALAGSGPRSLPPAPSAPAAPPSRPSKRAGAKPPGGSP